MFKTILTAVLAVTVIAGTVSAQQAKAPVAAKSLVPAEYMTLFNSYRGWVPETKEEPFANSLMNWALHAQIEVKAFGVAAIRNWLFTRSEARINELVREHETDIKSMFGSMFNKRGMHLVFSEVYTGDVDVLYQMWYNCVADSKRHLDLLVGKENVLVWVNWFEDKKVGADKECTAEFESLSSHYGVAELSADDLTAIGFLSRRHAANTKSSKFVSAEFIRKLVHDIFDRE